MLYPDPILSANVYAAGSLDEILRRALRPFRTAVHERCPDSKAYLWTMRYGCGGEHLKIRLHGPEGENAALREELGDAVERALAGLDATPDLEARPPTPPIDAEDLEGPHADRSWCWTTYRRSHLSLGSKPFLLDDGYVARFTRSLGAACEVALEALVPEADGAVPHMVRHDTLTRLVLDGLAALGFDDSQRRDYLYFHRDWLIRFPLLKSDGTLAKAREIAVHFEQIRDDMAAELETLGHLARSEWEKADIDADPWRRALADLWSYTAPLCEDPAFHVDPFAALPMFTPVFKVFHCAANQLGLSWFEEAVVHHLLVRAAAPAEPVRLDVLFEPEARELEEFASYEC